MLKNVNLTIDAATYEWFQKQSINVSSWVRHQMSEYKKHTESINKNNERWLVKDE